MKKILFLLALLSTVFMQTKAQGVSFEFSGGISAGALKDKMERQVSMLLTAINEADKRNGDVNFSGLDISDDASGSLAMTWNEVHFHTTENVLSYPCVELAGRYPGYRVRNIGVTMVPKSGSSYDSEMERTIYLDFDRNGRITDFNFAMDLHAYDEILQAGQEMKELDRRMQILDWCDKFANAYCQKNISFMQNIFSDDALIITGKVTMERVPGDVSARTVSKVRYIEQTKKQYLDRLLKVFRANKYVNVKFEDYSVVRHGSKPNYYGVTLKQKYHTPSYSDEGTLFLIWDFTNEDAPRILVRAWQPTTEEAFKLGDFKLPK